MAAHKSVREDHPINVIIDSLATTISESKRSAISNEAKKIASDYIKTAQTTVSDIHFLNSLAAASLAFASAKLNEFTEKRILESCGTKCNAKLFDNLINNLYDAEAIINFASVRKVGEDHKIARESIGPPGLTVPVEGIRETLPLDLLKNISPMKSAGGKICRYDIEGLLGEGSFGKVYDVRSRNGKKYAIKKQELRPEQWMELFTHSYFKHPNIVPLRKVLIGCLSSSKEVGTVMLLSAGTLAKLLETREFIEIIPINPAIKLWRFKIAHDLLCGLAYIHENKFMHYDLKPSNILINKSGVAQIADFGSVESKYGEDYGLYSDQITTPPWRSPEFQCGVEKRKASADIWALGLIFLELFFPTIRNPFFVKGSTDFDLPLLVFRYLEPSKHFVDSLSTEQYYKPISRRCISLLKELQKTPTIVRPKSLEYLLSEEDRNVMARHYYTPKEYNAIWDMIDSMLQIDPLMRPTARSLLDSTFFKMLPETCPIQTMEKTEDIDIHPPISTSFVSSPEPVKILAQIIWDDVQELEKNQKINLAKDDRTRRLLITACVRIAAYLLGDSSNESIPGEDTKDDDERIISSFADYIVKHALKGKPGARTINYWHRFLKPVSILVSPHAAAAGAVERTVVGAGPGGAAGAAGRTLVSPYAAAAGAAGREVVSPYAAAAGAAGREVVGAGPGGAASVVPSLPKTAKKFYPEFYSLRRAPESPSRKEKRSPLRERPSLDESIHKLVTKMVQIRGSSDIPMEIREYEHEGKLVMNDPRKILNDILIRDNLKFLFKRRQEYYGEVEKLLKTILRESQVDESVINKFFTSIRG